MKKFLSIFLTLFVCGLSVLTLTACEQKTYKIIGIVDVEADKIVLYNNLTDLEKSYIDQYKDFTIKLGFRNDVTLSYSVTEGSLNVCYTYTGRYTLEGEVLTIYLKNKDGSEIPTKYQYTNNRIIYYMPEFGENGVYFAFE